MASPGPSHGFAGLANRRAGEKSSPSPMAGFTKPPASMILAASVGRSGLWSVERATAESTPSRLVPSTQRQSPTLATQSVERRMSTTLAHAPDSVASVLTSVLDDSSLSFPCTCWKACASAAGGFAAGGVAAQQIVLGVQELVLSAEPRGSSRRLSVRVEALGMEEAPLETPAMVGRGGEAMRFNWSHSIPVASGNRAWGALARALATTQEEDSDVYFTVRDAETGGSVGEAYVNLEKLLKGGVDKAGEAVQVLDAKDRLVGRLTLTVRALDALRTVKATEEQARARGLSTAPPPPPPPPPPPTPPGYAAGAYGAGRAPTGSAGFDVQPPTAVRHLTTAQLQTVLRGRGVRLGEGSAQSHAYYVELCRSQGLVEVTAAELAGSAPAASGVGGGIAAGVVAAQQVVIGVQELVLSAEPRGSSRRLSVRVEALGMEDAPMETPAMVGRGGEAVRFNWSHSIPVAAGNRAWGALAM